MSVSQSNIEYPSEPFGEFRNIKYVNDVKFQKHQCGKLRSHPSAYETIARGNGKVVIRIKYHQLLGQTFSQLVFFDDLNEKVVEVEG